MDAEGYASFLEATIDRMLGESDVPLEDPSEGGGDADESSDAGACGEGAR